MSNNTFTANVIQFMKPDGRQVIQYTDLPIEYKEKYEDMESRGCRFEAEVLNTGDISLSIGNPRKDVDVDIEIVSNGPRVKDALIDMLNRQLWTINRKY